MTKKFHQKSISKLRLPRLQPQAQTLICARQLVYVPWVVRVHITDMLMLLVNVVQQAFAIIAQVFIQLLPRRRHRLSQNRQL